MDEFEELLDRRDVVVNRIAALPQSLKDKYGPLRGRFELKIRSIDRDLTAKVWKSSPRVAIIELEEEVDEIEKKLAIPLTVSDIRLMLQSCGMRYQDKTTVEMFCDNVLSEDIRIAETQLEKTGAPESLDESNSLTIRCHGGERFAVRLVAKEFHVYKKYDEGESYSADWLGWSPAGLVTQL